MGVSLEDKTAVKRPFRATSISYGRCVFASAKDTTRVGCCSDVTTFRFHGEARASRPVKARRSLLFSVTWR